LALVAELFLDDLAVFDGVVGDFLHLHAWEGAVFGFDIHFEDDGEAGLADEWACGFAGVHGDGFLPFFVFGDHGVAALEGLAVAFDAGP